MLTPPPGCAQLNGAVASGWRHEGHLPFRPAGGAGGEQQEVRRILMKPRSQVTEIPLDSHSLCLGF
eukprot:COSAG01_NODE_144_length_24108_cov_11.490441_2_plen_66_part_00